MYQRYRWIVVTIALLCPGVQLKGENVSIDQLSRLIGIAVSHHTSDKRLASRIATLELRERLTEDTLAALQRRVPGAISAATRTELADESAFLEPPDSELPHDPPPSLADQQSILMRAAAYAATYASRLPNLICTKTVRRYDDNPGTPSATGGMLGKFQFRDAIVGEVTYSKDQEHIKVTSGRRENAATEGSGLETVGEFGNIMISLFSPRVHATTSWSHWELLHGKRIAVFRYSVTAANSTYTLSYCCEGGRTKELRTAYEGSVFIDPETGAVANLTLVAVNIPLSFPMRQAKDTVEYGPVIIGENPYLCPIRSVNESAFQIGPSGRILVHYLDESRFSQYRKFEVESGIVAAGRAHRSAPSSMFEVPEALAVARKAAVYDLPPLIQTESQAAAQPQTLADLLFPFPKLPSFRQPVAAGRQPNAAATFRERVDVVTVPVVVRDASGRAVNGLSQADFEVFDNRKPQTITSFAEEASSGPDGFTSTSATGQNALVVQSNAASAERYIAYVFDDVNLQRGDLAQIRSAVVRMLTEIVGRGT